MVCTDINQINAFQLKSPFIEKKNWKSNLRSWIQFLKIMNRWRTAENKPEGKFFVLHEFGPELKPHKYHPRKNFNHEHYLFCIWFSYKNTDDLQDSKEWRGHLYSSLPLPPMYEHSHIYLQFFIEMTTSYF